MQFFFFSKLLAIICDGTACKTTATIPFAHKRVVDSVGQQLFLVRYNYLDKTVVSLLYLDRLQN